MTVWLDPQPVDVPEALRQAVGGHPLVAETLARRGILTPEAARAFLDPAAYRLASPFDLPGMDRAVERLRLALAGGERIAVWGDFDADGQTATALLVENLAALGGDVRYAVPGRAEGHGLHPVQVERLVAQGGRLILTCDTGITAHAAAAEAARLGVDLLITDHHAPDADLPPAAAVVQPGPLPADHALRPLTGVGVAWAVAHALDPSGAARSLDLVALGTVADVGTLVGDNRALVQRGLEALRAGPRPGLLAVCQAAEVRPAGLGEGHLAFVLGPRLNAVGRLADAAVGVELLLTPAIGRAQTLAAALERLNTERQWRTRQVAAAALAQIEADPSLAEQAALVLADPDWPVGVLGIVAGRLAERLGKPALLLATPPGHRSGSGMIVPALVPHLSRRTVSEGKDSVRGRAEQRGTPQVARGSARSVPGVDLVAVLRDCAPLLLDWGGHPAAAGLAVEPGNIPALRAAMAAAVAARSGPLAERPLAIDAYVELPDLHLGLVAELARLAPFGRGNPPLTLAVRDLRLLSEVSLGREAEHRRLTVEDRQDRTQTVFWWQGSDWPLPQGRFDLAVTIRSSDYRGLPEVQVEWIAAREREPVAAGQVQIEPVPASGRRVRDHRTEPDPEATLRTLLAAGEGQVWAEGRSPADVDARTRRELAPGPRLVVWTAPPGPRELQAALQRVAPQEIALFAVDAGLDRVSPFLERLAGLSRFALRARDGWVELEAAAARLGHRLSTVEAGLEWLAASGQVRLVAREGARWRLAPGDPGSTDPNTAAPLLRRLDGLLAETSAYRAFFRTAPVDSLRL